MSETTVRLLTPPGAGGVALLRLAGRGAAALVRQAFHGRRWPAPGEVAYGELRDAQGRVDDVLLTRVDEARFELGCHAGPAIQARVLATFAALGARPAPAPVTLAAELELALGDAVSERACRMLLAQSEHWAHAAELPADLERARAQLAALGASATASRLLQPTAVALRGAPNAGKSSLLNALLGRTRAVVSAEAGTTRDAVRVPLVLAGLPLLLIDTAGDRETPDALEQAGIARARQAGAAAGLRLVVVDGTEALPAWIAEEPAPALLVRSKADLVAQRSGPGLWVSAHTGEGLAALEQALGDVLLPPEATAGACVFTPRQLAWVERAQGALDGGDLPGARAALAQIVAEDPAGSSVCNS